MQIVQLKFWKLCLAFTSVPQFQFLTFCQPVSQLIDYHLSPNSVSVFCCLKDHLTVQTISQTYGTIPSQSAFRLFFRQKRHAQIKTLNFKLKRYESDCNIFFFPSHAYTAKALVLSSACQKAETSLKTWRVWEITGQTVFQPTAIYSVLKKRVRLRVCVCECGVCFICVPINLDFVDTESARWDGLYTHQDPAL